MYSFYETNHQPHYHCIFQREHFSEPKRMAILFYGLTRNLRGTAPPFKKHVMDVLKNNNIECDIFIHTYSIYGEYKNNWAGESTIEYKNEHVVDLLKPIYSLTENQDDILSNGH
jgi:hypothetical protein